jgi:formamidopyrimidine-DNA glycosylase
MIEFPEAVSLANQINVTLRKKRITGVTAGHTPHKLAWFYGDRARYSDILVGRTIGKATACGCMVEIGAEGTNILFGEGAGIRFHAAGSGRPSKHQLLIELEDGSALSASVQMYGGVGCFEEGQLDNPYYRVAKQKPHPLSSKFSETYFEGIISGDGVQNLSLKALLATEQRIPGLGNGILQDILFNAKQHPKKKTKTLVDRDRRALFNAVRATIESMASNGGRDTELDLFGHPGGYKTILSKFTVDKPCAVCGTVIKKESYLGGAIYFCEKCQTL